MAPSSQCSKGPLRARGVDDARKLVSSVAMAQFSPVVDVAAGAADGLMAGSIDIAMQNADSR